MNRVDAKGYINYKSKNKNNEKKRFILFIDMVDKTKFYLSPSCGETVDITSFEPKKKAAQVFCYSKDLIYKVDRKKALSNMPPLLKTYLSMGAWVSDHAVVDLNMQTLHLFTGVEISKIPKSRKNFLLNLA